MPGPDWIRVPESGEYLGYGSRDFGNLTDDEKHFAANHARAVTIAESEDPHADYSYDDWALCELDGLYYAFNTSGCSCPSPSETWELMFKGDRESLLNWLATPINYNAEPFAEFLRKIEAAGWTLRSPAPSPRPQYDW